MSATGEPFRHSHKVAFKLRVSTGLAAPNVCFLSKESGVPIADSNRKLNLPMRRTIRAMHEGCWRGSNFEIGQEVGIRTRTVRFTGEDAAVTPQS